MIKIINRCDFMLHDLKQKKWKLYFTFEKINSKHSKILLKSFWKHFENILQSFWKQDGRMTKWQKDRITGSQGHMITESINQSVTCAILQMLSHLKIFPPQHIWKKVYSRHPSFYASFLFSPWWIPGPLQINYTQMMLSCSAPVWI